MYNEDCLEWMRRQENGCVDLIVTSPPYNTSRGGRLETYEGRYESYNDDMSNEDYIEWTLRLFEGFDKVLSKDGCVCYNLSYSAENTELMFLTVSEIIKRSNFTIADEIVWKKKAALPNNKSSNKLTRICEFVFVFCRKGEFNTFRCNKKVSSVRDTGQPDYENIFNFFEAPNNDGSCDIHKATFSTLFVRKLLNIYAVDEGRCIVYDPFMGTGTTAVGCIEDKFDWVGTEISERYCEYAGKRIEVAKRESLTLW